MNQYNEFWVGFSQLGGNPNISIINDHNPVSVQDARPTDKEAIKSDVMWGKTIRR